MPQKRYCYHCQKSVRILHIKSVDIVIRNVVIYAFFQFQLQKLSRLAMSKSCVQQLGFLDDGLFLGVVESVHLHVQFAVEGPSCRLTLFLLVFLLFLLLFSLQNSNNIFCSTNLICHTMRAVSSQSTLHPPYTSLYPCFTLYTRLTLVFIPALHFTPALH